MVSHNPRHDPRIALSMETLIMSTGCCREGTVQPYTNGAQKPAIQRPLSAKNETEIKTYLMAVVTRSLYLLYLTRKILSYRIINVLAASGWLNFFSFFFFCKQICVVQVYVFMHVYVCVDMHVQVCMHICTHAGRGQRLVSVSSLVALPLDIDPDLGNSLE